MTRTGKNAKRNLLPARARKKDDVEPLRLFSYLCRAIFPHPVLGASAGCGDVAERMLNNEKSVLH